MQKKKFLPKKNIIVKCNDQGGDLSKPWYVHWRQDGLPKKKYGKLAHIPDVSQRRTALLELQELWQGRVGDLPAKASTSHRPGHCF